MGCQERVGRPVDDLVVCVEKVSQGPTRKPLAARLNENGSGLPATWLEVLITALESM
jgi:hypothetical protein